MENQKIIPLSIVIGALIIGGAIIYNGSNANNQANPGQNPSNIAGNNNQVPTPQAVDIKDVKIENTPFIGQANAKVVIATWSDYKCSFCKKFEEESINKIIEEYVNTGKAKIVFKDYAFLSEYSTTAALAGRAVWETAPDKYYEWREKVYQGQGTFSTKEDLLKAAQSLGIDSNKVNQLMTSKASEYQKAIDGDKAEGTSFGINGTPGSIVGKTLISGAQPYATVKSSIDTALTQ